MSTGWIITIIHVIIFFISRKILNKKKRELEKVNAQLTTEIVQLKGKNDYYKRQLASKS